MNKLQQAVIEQLGYTELDEDCISQLEDIVHAGASAGFSGFIYYTETEQFYKDNKELIIEELKDIADNFGQDSIISTIKGFRCGSDFTEEEIGATVYGGEIDTYVANCLAWFALEQVAYQLTEEQ